tara:strand:+ start:1907 stop:2233 length:327 start_codon:yes stop_codon:yes gene_type:complete
MSKHTKGPWRADGWTITADTGDPMSPTSTVGLATFQRRFGSVIPATERTANAKLMAAAPCLVDALRWVKDAIESEEGRLFQDRDMAWVSNVIVEITGALEVAGLGGEA